jgi:hypothetical protein
MLRVPEGAMPGDQLLFEVPVGCHSNGAKIFKEKMAVVPENMTTGRYFAATIEPEAPEQNEVDEIWV